MSGRRGVASPSDDATAPSSPWGVRLIQWAFTMGAPFALFLVSVLRDDYFSIKHYNKKHDVGFFNIGRTYTAPAEHNSPEETYFFSCNQVGTLAIYLYGAAIILMLSLLFAYIASIVALHFDSTQVKWFNLVHNFVYMIIVVTFIVLGKALTVSSATSENKIATGNTVVGLTEYVVSSPVTEPDVVEYGLSSIMMFIVLGIVLVAHGLLGIMQSQDAGRQKTS